MHFVLSRSRFAITIATFSFLALTACGSHTTSRHTEVAVPVNETASDHQAFAELFRTSAESYAIPAGLLESIAYVDTRWHPATSEESPETEEGHRQVYGVMGLHDDGVLGQNLREAASLIGHSPSELTRDSALNVAGSAALLAKIAKEQGVSTAAVNAWSDVVRAFSGIPDLEDSDAYVAEVYRTLRDGVNDAGIVIAARPELALPAARAVMKQAMVDVEALTASAASPKPATAFEASPNYSLNGLPKPKYIVIHVTEGDFAGSVSWLKSKVSQASSHYIIRSSDGLIKQLVNEKDKAWHARCWNGVSIGIEHEGFVARPEKYFTDAMYSSSAKLVRYLADKYAIPKTNIRIIGHNFGDTSAIKQTDLADCNTHNDPGPGWNWTKYLGLINAAATPAKVVGSLW